MLFLDVTSKRTCAVHMLSDAMCDSLLQMARDVRPAQGRIDIVRLKAQREEKRRKDELALQDNLSKASEDHIEAWFR